MDHKHIHSEYIREIRMRHEKPSLLQKARQLIGKSADKPPVSQSNYVQEKQKAIASAQMPKSSPTKALHQEAKQIAARMDLTQTAKPANDIDGPKATPKPDFSKPGASFPTPSKGIQHNEQQQKIGQLSPGPSPANSYLSAKKEKALEQAYYAQKQQARIPYPSRS